jgi:nitrite reductase/ring-hydroxylating ferredoxin subunit
MWRAASQEPHPSTVQRGCDVAAGFPSLPLVGKVGKPAPLQTFPVRIEDGNVEVDA